MNQQSIHSLFINSAMALACTVLSLQANPSPACSDSMPHPVWSNRTIRIFEPTTPGPHPVVFFLHGIGAENPSDYGGLIQHMTQQGFCVVHVPYPTLTAITRPWEVTAALDSGFDAASRKWIHRMDTLHMGLVGHSYGGGALPHLAVRYLQQRRWGCAGSFMHIMAPWFSWGVSDNDLASFPAQTSVTLEVFSSDRINDHRMAIELFRAMGGPFRNRRFFSIRDSADGPQTGICRHDLPMGNLPPDTQTNTLDSIAVYALFDQTAVSALPGRAHGYNSFWSDPAAHWPVTRGSQRAIAWVCGSTDPAPQHPQEEYVNGWNHVMNPRCVEFGPGGQTRRHNPGSALTMLNIYNFLTLRMVGQQDRSIVRSDSISVRWIWHPITGDRKIMVFAPEKPKAALPLFLFIPALFAGSSDDYEELCTAFARSGRIAILCYNNLLESEFANRPGNIAAGFETALEILRSTADTTRIIIAGHGYGGAELPAVAQRLMNGRGWGKKEALVWAIAPGSPHGIVPSRTPPLPPHTQAAITLFEDSWHHSWKFGPQLVHALNVPSTQTRFVTIRRNNTGNRHIPTPRHAPDGEAERLFFCSSLAMSSTTAVLEKRAISVVRDNKGLYATEGISPVLNRRPDAGFFTSPAAHTQEKTQCEPDGNVLR